MDYNLLFVERIFATFKRKPKRILVVGAGRCGYDLKIIHSILGESAEIFGIDIVSDVGAEFKAPNVCYLECNVCDMPFRSEYFDLAYSFATFEHIFSVKDAWQSMINVLRPGGIIHTLASPLWCSPFGHHKPDIFAGHPWAHIVNPSVEELLNYCLDNAITSCDQTELIHHIRYCLSSKYFNKLKPCDYAKAVTELDGLSSFESSFQKTSMTEHPNYFRCINMGFSQEDLLAETHMFSGIKT